MTSAWFIVFLVLSLIAGIAAGVFLTTYMMVIVSILSFVLYLIQGNSIRVSEDEFFACTSCSIVVNFAMWVTFFFVETSLEWVWVGVFLREGILR